MLIKYDFVFRYKKLWARHQKNLKGCPNWKLALALKDSRLPKRLFDRSISTSSAGSVSECRSPEVILEESEEEVLLDHSWLFLFFLDFSWFYDLLNQYQFTDCFLGPLLSLLIVPLDPTTIYPFKIRKQKSVRAAVSSGETVVVSNDYRDLLASGVLAALYVINEKAREP